MKLIQVCPLYYPEIGGVETYVKELSERLVRRGYEVEVVCTGQRYRFDTRRLLTETINGVQIKRFRALAPKNAYYMAPQIYHYLKKADCDIIHAHSYHALPAFFAMLAKNGRKFIFTPYYHGKGHTSFRDLLHIPYKYLGSRILREANKVVCVSNYEKELIKAKFGISDEKLVYIPNGLNLDEFKANGTERDKKRILYVGRLEKYKNIQSIIKSLLYLNGFKLVIVGKGSYEKQLRELAFKKSVDVIWLRDLTRAELLGQYKSAGVFVSLSPFESFGITVAEALASGTHCIVSNEGALKEFVDKKTCFGISQREVDGGLLWEYVLEVASKKDNDFSELPKDKIKDWDAVVDNYERVYEEITK